MALYISLKKAIELIFSFNKEVYFIAYLSLYVAFFSTLVSAIIGIPLTFLINFSNYRIKKILSSLLNSLMALPTVVIGLFVYGFISRSGPFGFLALLFTPIGIIIGQTILGIPIIVSFFLTGLSKVDNRLYETLTTLGVNKFQFFIEVIKETKFIILSSVLAGFGRVIGEVGVSMMLGGNIRWYTRTLTTAIALESSKGEFHFALALGIILLILAILINFFLNLSIKGK
jgi:tungstate transport system permease protein